MVNRCVVCGSIGNVQLVYDSFSEEGKYKCHDCVNKEFTHGSHVVKFTDTSHPQRPAYYMNLKTEADLELVMTLGQRAQKFRAKGFEASFFMAHQKGRRIGLVSMSLGQANSIIQLRGHVDKLRMWMETSAMIEKERLRNEPNDDDDPALFSPINPQKDDEDMPILFSPINPPKSAV